MARTVEELLLALRDHDPDVRRDAIRALEEMGNAAVQALIRDLRSENSGIRADAALAIGKVGQAAKDAVSVLRKARQDKDYLVRAYAVWALEMIVEEIKG